MNGNRVQHFAGRELPCSSVFLPFRIQRSAFGISATLLFAATIAVRHIPAAETGHLKVVATEPGTSRPLACNVYLAAGGKAIYAPGYPRWERDGGFSCDGRFAAEVPAGKVELLVERGPEWESRAETVEIVPEATRTVTIALTRWIDMNARGWYSGDLHVHRPVADMPLLMRAADLNIAPVLTYWNDRKIDVKPPYLVEAGDHAAGLSRPRFYHTLNQEDERVGGAILMFNLLGPVTVEGVYPSWPSGFAYHESALKMDAHVEQEKPFWWEAPVHVALGRVASMGIVHNHFQRRGLMENEAWGRARDRDQYPGPLGFCLYTLDLYYRYLNLGWDIPVSAGSASGVLANPLGYCRTYVQMDRFDYDEWFEGLRAGRNFATNGPMLFATVNGRPAGTHFEVEAQKRFETTVRFEVLCRESLDRAEIVVSGKVLATFRPAAGNPKQIIGEHRLSLDESGWIAVRAFEAYEPTLRFAHTSPFYVTIGGKRRRDREAARFFVQWMDDLIARPEKAPVSKDRPERNPVQFRAAEHARQVIEIYRKARAVYVALAN